MTEPKHSKVVVGYSEKPLAQKLGIKSGYRVIVRRAPDGYLDWLTPAPERVMFGRTVSSTTDLVHLFVTRREVLASELATCRKTLRGDATVWVSWPKKASGMPSEVSESVVREVALPMGWVDVKVCAVSAVWSGLKLVVRKELR